MKFLPTLFAVTSVFAATSAIAGPSVTVTFKNQATAEATYTIITSNETSTYANASGNKKACRKQQCLHRHQPDQPGR
ncbi:hypothetical protein [Methylobacter sp.]|uniref:hypothetical protein n=1 Tax=Methylobacter sp. TaxID=2051955 RepID=UPI002487C407|nr:hypothetical protein [Methylobacter sp.]MDI1277575.1 hypothetical protein [Methylobacter sp.]MDI1358140.1 hypothetical protein [Methylobacter sp.]